jgi:protein-L-isoaspartate(D-aspartate) O-methyltransferase
MQLLDQSEAREQMVRRHLVARGIRDPDVLGAMRSVPREAFLPPELEEFAYEDAPLPIERGQTISQPYIVALMTAAAQLRPGDRVLEVGTGSGYAAAVLARIARDVYTIERHEDLARVAAERLARLGFGNVSVRHGDGTLGWPEHAPYDAIIVAAGGPNVPEALVEQLAPGGRLVIPVGEGRSVQRLLRVTRTADGRLRQDELGDVRFVPLIGEQGWMVDARERGGRPAQSSSRPATLARLVREVAEPLESIDSHDLDPLLDRLSGSKLVLVGEATHGTSEFYRMRARITQELIRTSGFTIVAVEADWPDARKVTRYVQGLPDGHRSAEPAFARFPMGMWRNHETWTFVEWLRVFNAEIREPGRRAGFYGLDLYSLFTSIRSVLDYLERVDPPAARLARERYSCLTPWQADPQAYARAALTGRYRVCEKEAVAMLRDMVRHELEYAERDGDRFLDAVQNARLIADAERYYRAMYYGASESWNQRDRHMFDTLERLLDFHGPSAKAIVWAHNSHLGDARATEMSARGELNLGQLCRQRFNNQAVLVGFGTDHGTVAAAHEWDGPMDAMTLRPAHPESYERVFHDAEIKAFLLPLREPRREEVRAELASARLERAVGVIYRPETELQSHYFHASLPHQFDEYIWFDETRAVRPITSTEARKLPAAHPLSIEPT